MNSKRNRKFHKYNRYSREDNAIYAKNDERIVVQSVGKPFVINTFLTEITDTFQSNRLDDEEIDTRPVC